MNSYLDPSSFSKIEFSNRMKSLKNVIAGIDIAFIFSRPDLYYYSSIGLDGFLEIYGEEITHYVGRNMELAKAESMFDVKKMVSNRIFKELGKLKKVKTIGLEFDILPYRTVSYISKAFGNPELVDISGKLRSIRAVKSAEEIKQMELSCLQTDRSFEIANEVIKPGLSEIEVSAEIERFLKRDGHPGWIQVRTFRHNLSNISFVMTGESAATLNSKFGPFSGRGVTRMHCNGSSRRKIKIGDPVVIDTTGFSNGYISDVTRTFMVGSVDKNIIEAHQVSAEVQERSKKLFKPGANSQEIYRELIDLVDELGYKDNFMGIHSNKIEFIGHGVGLELDELPLISSKHPQILKAGNLIAMEPKLVIDKPKAGVGIEETWVIRENGGEILSKFPYSNKI